jgi:hypothetical protein
LRTHGGFAFSVSSIPARAGLVTATRTTGTCCGQNPRLILTDDIKVHDLRQYYNSCDAAFHCFQMATAVMTRERAGQDKVIGS